MAAKHLLSIAELSDEDLAHLINQSVEFATGKGDGRRSLAGKVVGIYFRKPSTRTRTSFTVGAFNLGAQVIAYGPNDLQLVTGETIEDTGRVLSRYLNALVIRTNGPLAEMQTLASQDEMAIVNAMSENEHPTQVIADLSTIKERFGRLAGIEVLYLGEGNNTASALALAAAKIPGLKITFVTPKNYGLHEPALKEARHCAGLHRAVIEQHHNMDDLPKRVDVVYTTRWQTMGVAHNDPRWREKFLPYSVTQSVMDRVSKPSGTIFLHDLPAVRGDEVTDKVLNGSQSLAWRQSSHKMFSAMAILEWCVNGG
jgi:ornithine carbamoyltransferase